jgi:carboxyl-terminal processing protease
MKSERVRLVFFSACLGLCLFFLFERSFLPGIPPQKPVYKGFDLLGTVARLVRDDYIEERDPARTMEGAYKGLIDSLDPVSSYLGRDASNKFLRRDSRWADIGVVLFKRSFGLFPQVVGLAENSPAEKAGVKPGDAISAMDGLGTLGMSSLEANLYLKDLEQKSVLLKVVRDNETLEIKVERAVLFAASHSVSSIDGFSILKIHNIYAPCVSEIRKNALPLLKSRKNSYILDLRDCSEGDVEEARRLLNLFIKSEAFGHFEKKNGVKEPVGCPASPALPNLPSAVWVNSATMGPAEMVAGVLQEAGKIKVLGTVTPGLVSRQELHQLQDGSAVLLTSAVFSLASGKKLWEEGVVPDEKIDPADGGSAVYMKKTRALFPNR